MRWWAGKNDSIDSSARVMSNAVPKVATVLKKDSAPSDVCSRRGTNNVDVGLVAPDGTVHATGLDVGVFGG